jgi:mannose-1-phosphate guanylyltransferase
MGDVVGMILCAGLGTRLRPLTNHVPKPAVPLCGVSLIRWNLALLRGAGVRRAAINTHHLPEPMAAAARDAAAALGVELAVSHEPVIAGTGGALREARGLLASAEAIFLVNGDILFDVDLGEALSVHRRSGALATMVLAPMPEGAGYAAVETDSGGAVRRIAGRFGPGGDGLSPWHFTGVHVLSPEVLELVPAEPLELDVNRHVYPPLMERGRVRGHRADGYWNDLGTPARYLEASRDVLAGRVPLARFSGAGILEGLEPRAPGVHVHGTAVVEAGATLTAPCALGRAARVAAGARVGPGAFVGDGALVGAGAAVRDAVVWERTAVAPGESLERCIAAGALRVAAD